MPDLRVLNKGTNAYKTRFGSTPDEATKNFIKDGYVPIDSKDYTALAALDARANPKDSKNTLKPLIRIIYNQENENKILAGGQFLYIAYTEDNRINVKNPSGYDHQRPEYMRIKPIQGGRDNFSIQFHKVDKIFIKWPRPEDTMRTVTGPGLNINVTKRLYNSLTNGEP